MKKHAIFQLDCYSNKQTKKYQFLHNFCVPTVHKYCNKYDIEYLLVTSESKQVFTYQEKINLFIDIVNNKKYEKTLFLDLDIYIQDHSPNIFSIECENIEGCLAMNYRLKENIDHIKNILSNKISDNEYFRLLNCSIAPNGGVLLFNNDKIQTQMFQKNQIENMLTHDEAFITYKIANRDLSFTIISDLWNNRTLTKESISKSYFIHFLSHSFFDDDGYDKTRNTSIENLKNLLSK